MGRPKVKVSEIRRLGRLQCTKAEAAGFLGIGAGTFSKILKSDERAAQAWDEGQQEGKVSLRRKQFRLASKNATMAIFLGKQWLGQTDVVVNEHTGRGGGPIETLDLTKLDAKQRQDLRALLERAKRSGRDS